MGGPAPGDGRRHAHRCRQRGPQPHRRHRTSPEGNPAGASRGSSGVGADQPLPITRAKTSVSLAAGFIPAATLSLTPAKRRDEGGWVWEGTRGCPPINKPGLHRTPALTTYETIEEKCLTSS